MTTIVPTPIKTVRKYVKKGPGTKQNNTGLFKKGHAPINHSTGKVLYDALMRIINMPANTLPPVKTNAEVIAQRLWEYALVASPSNPKGFVAIQEVFDRVDGKSAPSKEELAKDSTKVIVCLPTVNSNNEKN